MTYEQALILTVTALAGVVAVLWRQGVRDVLWLRTGYEDLVKRVRTLEDTRLDDERRHGHDIQGLAREILKCREADRKVGERLVMALQCRPCLVDLRPDAFSSPTTETLAKNDSTCEPTS